MDINYSEILCNNDDEDFNELSELRDTKEELSHHKDFFNSEIFNTLS